MGPGHEYPGFGANLTDAESWEMTSINRKINEWGNHLERCRKAKPRQAPDYSLQPSDEEFFRLNELRDKFWSPLSENHYDTIKSTQNVGTTSVSMMLGVNFGLKASK